MKTIYNFNNFIKESWSDDEYDTELDIPMELEYKLRTLDDTSELTIDDFLDECGIDYEYRTDFGISSAFKQKDERFKGMSDKEFFKLYKDYKDKL